MPRKKPKVDVTEKVDVVCQKIVEGMVPAHILASVKKQFGSGISYFLFQKLRNGTYAKGNGQAAELYRKKWAAKIAAMSGNKRVEAAIVAPSVKAPVSSRKARELQNQILDMVATELNLNVDTIQSVNITHGGYTVMCYGANRPA